MSQYFFNVGSPQEVNVTGGLFSFPNLKKIILHLKWLLSNMGLISQTKKFVIFYYVHDVDPSFL